MKSGRQEKIIALVSKYEIETQEDLIGKLRREGYNVTQATVSRDIRELKLTKVMTPRGAYRYILPTKKEQSEGFKFNSALVESIKTVDYACNLVVLKTYPGMAQAVATGLDAIDSNEILGCVAGDDTIFVAAQSAEKAKDISEKIKTMLKAI
ncbi:MAG: arginine repressor [Clostridia bacterium]|nr:arginine repressor [Clostridia bacterium]